MDRVRGNDTARQDSRGGGGGGGGGGAGGLQKGAGALRGVKEGMNDRPLRYTPDH